MVDRQVNMSMKGRVQKKRESRRQSNDTAVGRQPVSMYRRASIRNMLNVQQSSESPLTTLAVNIDAGLLLFVCLFKLSSSYFRWW